MFSRKKIITYVLIIILIKVIGFSLFFMYSVEKAKKEVEHKKLNINPIETISVPKKVVLSKEEELKQKNNLMLWKLEEKMKVIYTSSVEVYDKKKKKKANIEALKKHLDTFSNTDIFVANFYENTIYGSNDYIDINARTVVLEEIQKVRRRGEGFIISTISNQGTKRYILVKDLKFLNLYIGINIIE